MLTRDASDLRDGLDATVRVLYRCLAEVCEPGPLDMAAVVSIGERLRSVRQQATELEVK